jgi:hypothetical protein
MTRETREDRWGEVAEYKGESGGELSGRACCCPLATPIMKGSGKVVSASPSSCSQ